MSSSSSKLTCELLVILFPGKHSKALVLVAMVAGCETIVLDGLHAHKHTHTDTDRQQLLVPEQLASRLSQNIKGLRVDLWQKET